MLLSYSFLGQSYHTYRGVFSRGELVRWCDCGLIDGYRVTYRYWIVMSRDHIPFCNSRRVSPDPSKPTV